LYVILVLSGILIGAFPTLDIDYFLVGNSVF
jgi:hypothetical protein